MFGKRDSEMGRFVIDSTLAINLVADIGAVYADLCAAGVLVKKRSSLPCPWYVARECFMIAYRAQHRELSDQLESAYLTVFSDLSFFVEDSLCENYERSLTVAVRHRMEHFGNSASGWTERSVRNDFANEGVIAQTREEVFSSLLKMETYCPREHLIVLAETLSYCSALYRIMWDEWAAYTTLIAHEDRMRSGNQQPSQ